MRAPARTARASAGARREALRSRAMSSSTRDMRWRSCQSRRVVERVRELDGAAAVRRARSPRSSCSRRTPRASPSATRRINALVLPRLRRGARGGGRRRRGARARRRGGSAARRAVHRQGAAGGGGDAGAERLAAAGRPRQRRRLRAGGRGCARRARSCSARRTSPSSRCGGTRSTGCSARPPTRTTDADRGRLVGRRGGGDRARGCRRWGWAPTSAARSATRATSSGCSACKPGRDTVPFAEHAPVAGGPGSPDDGRGRADGALRGGPRAGAGRARRRRALAAAQRPSGSRCSRRTGCSRSRATAARRSARGSAGRGGYATVEAAPPNAAEVRGAFDLILGTEAAAALPRGRRRPRSPSCLPTSRRCSRRRGGFKPSWERVPRRLGAARALRGRGRRVVRRAPGGAVPGRAGGRAAAAVARGRRRSTACRRGRAASSRSPPTRARSGCRRSACR